MMEYDIHTVLDFLTLGATAWVIYTLQIPLKDTYQAEQDSVQSYYVVSRLSVSDSDHGRTFSVSALLRVIFILDAIDQTAPFTACMVEASKVGKYAGKQACALVCSC